MIEIGHPVMRLFDNIARTHEGPAFHNEGTFSFLNRSARTACGRVRNLLEYWFDRYPDEEKQLLRSRFLNEFASAFYELFLHEMLFSLGCEVLVHPVLDETTSTHPDFLARFPECTEVFIEAVLCTDESKDEESSQSRLNVLYDEINKLNSNNFFLRLDTVWNPRGIQPSGRKIRAFLERSLKDLDPDEIFGKIERDGIFTTPSLVFRDGEFELEISLIPKPPGMRGRSGDRPIGIYPMESRWGGGTESLKNSIGRKTTRMVRSNGHISLL